MTRETGLQVSTTEFALQARRRVKRRPLGLVWIAIPITTLICSCATSPPRRPVLACTVFDFRGELTSGLINVPREGERTLLALVPDAPKCASYCWYQNPSGSIEAMTSGPDVGGRSCPSATGYEFVRAGDHWQFARENEYMKLDRNDRASRP
jgi:hypothetical protein